jgi:phosphatidylglycerophosphate synthase
MSAATPPRGIVALYRQSLKPADSWFNIYFARALAAPIVWLLARTPVTPNQVTFASTFVMCAALAAFVGVEGSAGLWLGVLGLELSYVLDCADGQLARVTGRTSEVGGALDFMMDELKAYLLVSAVALRLYLWSGPLWERAPVEAPLLVGLASLVAFASAISLTRFTRSPEYARATGTVQLKNGQAAGEGRGGGALWPVKVAARLVSQYPTTFPLFVVFDELDVFLYSYGSLHLLYAGQACLGVMVALAIRAPRAHGHAPSPTPPHTTHEGARDEARAEESA